MAIVVFKIKFFCKINKGNDFKYLILLSFLFTLIESHEVDPNGYIAYCPCMGRFGNQADQFLGSLSFAKEINRTLILPPFVEYIPYKHGSFQIPFNTYFKVEPIQDYHRVITMEDFMTQISSSIWPADKRISFCYTEREEGKGCNAKEGNPFGPFWDNFKIDFVESEFYGPDLHYLKSQSNNLEKSWRKRFPSSEYPVLAFVGPPSSFPVEESNAPLQKFLIWSNEIEEKAMEFINKYLKTSFLGIHLRNGVDWSKACELVDGSRDGLFASPQCTGYETKKVDLKYDMCFPPTKTIINEVKRAVKKVKARSIFVASDKDHMLDELRSALKYLKVNVVKYNADSPHVDLAILGKADLFIGNCVSSYSAFVKRERDVRNLKSQFWAVDSQNRKNFNKEEL